MSGRSIAQQRLAPDTLRVRVKPTVRRQRRIGDMKLQIQPLVALADEKVRFVVTGLPPSAKVKISASLCLPWAPSVQLESLAWFTADSSGQVDLSKQKPDSGSYDYADSMGLISSAQVQDSKAIQKIGQNISVDQNLVINVAAECGQDRTSARLERLFLAPGVQRQKTPDELVGELFYTEAAHGPTTIALGGSGSYLGAVLPLAALLASHGLNALALSYFRDPGLPQDLAEIPLEYFENAFAWLSDNPITQGKGIQILAQSKGAELALLLASRYSRISKVAALAPHAYCFEGLNMKNVSSWSYRGESIPFIPYNKLAMYRHMLGCMIRNMPFGYTYVHEQALSAAKNKEAARIKVENAQADLLLFAGKQNNMWNTYDGCVVIMDTLRKCNYPHDYELVVYEDMGEPYRAPYVIPPALNKAQVAPRLVLSLGGTLEGNARAQADSWEKAIEFLRQVR
jgi:hypothetical protein